MSDARLGVAAAGSPTNYIDNEAVTTGAGAAYRQRVRIGGSSGALLAEVSDLGQLYVAEMTERSSSAGAPSNPSATGTITAYSGQGGAPAAGYADSSFSGGAPAAGSTVVVVPDGDHSSWSVFTTGTWTGTIHTEVSMNGTHWIPVNSRQSNGGRLANNFTANGLFRGAFGGMFAFRVRATSAFTGTCNVWISLGDDAAVFQNSDVVSQTESQYYASSAGLNSLYGSTSDLITFGSNPNDTPFFSLFNPNSAGGPVFYIWRIFKVGSATATIRRRRLYGSASVSGGSLMAIDNRGGVTTNTPTGVTRAGTALTVAGTTALQKTLLINANAPDTATEDFSLMVPPGQGLVFYYTSTTNGDKAAVEVVWSEGSFLT